MDDAELHYPPGAEPETPPAAEVETKPETPAPEVAPAEVKPEEKPEGDKPADEGKSPEGDKPADGDKPTDDLSKKPRSIYDDYKDKKQEAKDFQSVAITAAAALGLELKGNESPAELQELLQKAKDATTPKEKSDVADDLKAFAEEEDMSPEKLQKLIDLIGKRVPAPSIPDDLAKKIEDVTAWKQEQDTKARRAEEDAAIVAYAPTVKTLLNVSDDAELKSIMEEVTKLAHTKEFHDKEVAYIVWKKQAELSKLVSPKKPSFESAGKRGETTPDAPVDYGSGKVTPAQAQAATQSQGKTTYVVSNPK